MSQLFSVSCETGSSPLVKRSVSGELFLNIDVGRTHDLSGVRNVLKGQ